MRTTYKDTDAQGGSERRDLESEESSISDEIYARSNDFQETIMTAHTVFAGLLGADATRYSKENTRIPALPQVMTATPVSLDQRRRWGDRARDAGLPMCPNAAESSSSYMYVKKERSGAKQEEARE